jgi:hypothetical protein
MPETPDFEKLARQAISGSEFHIKRVAEQLRLVWNEGRSEAETLHRLWTEALGKAERAEAERDTWKAHYEKVVAQLDAVPPGAREALRLDAAVQANPIARLPAIEEVQHADGSITLLRDDRSTPGWYCASCGKEFSDRSAFYCVSGSWQHEEADGTASCGPVLTMDGKDPDA